MAKIKQTKSISVIERRESPEDFAQKIIEKPVKEITKASQEFQTIAETVAKSSVYIRNWYHDELRARYKHYDRMKRFDKFFPYARLGDDVTTTTLYVDEPTNEPDADICYQKAAIMKELGLNYVILEKDSTLFDALNQLGVFK